VRGLLALIKRALQLIEAAAIAVQAESRHLALHNARNISPHETRRQRIDVDRLTSAKRLYTARPLLDRPGCSGIVSLLHVKGEVDHLQYLKGME
jgi:hypothetical protein